MSFAMRLHHIINWYGGIGVLLASCSSSLLSLVSESSPTKAPINRKIAGMSIAKRRQFINSLGSICLLRYYVMLHAQSSCYLSYCQAATEMRKMVAPGPPVHHHNLLSPGLLKLFTLETNMNVAGTTFNLIQSREKG